jgi:hypothetical protein
VFTFTKEVGTVNKSSIRAANFSSSMTIGLSRRIQLDGVSCIYLKHLLSSWMSKIPICMLLYHQIFNSISERDCNSHSGGYEELFLLAYNSL